MAISEVVAPQKIGPYILKEEIGRGAFSMVCLAVHEKTHAKFACKIVPKRHLMEIHMESRFESEVRILQRLEHHSICRMYDLSQDTLNYYVILELCEQGSLFSRILSAKKIPEREAKFIFKQIVVAVDYIHKHGIAHRDLKPENVLIDAFDRIKIIDFGLSAFQDDGTLLSTFCGSTCYASPECLSGREYDGIKSDTWSLGVILYTMLLGELPWTCRNRPQQVDQIVRGEYFVSVSVSPAARSLIYGMMTVDPSLRMTPESVLESPWLKDVSDPDWGSVEKMPTIAAQTLNVFFAPRPDDSTKPGEGKSLLKLLRKRTVLSRQTLLKGMRKSPVAVSMQHFRL